MNTDIHAGAQRRVVSALMLCSLATIVLAMPSAHAQQAISWQYCANEYRLCAFEGTRRVRFGADGRYVEKTLTARNGGAVCARWVLGDPHTSKPKTCALAVDTPTQPPPNSGDVSTAFTASNAEFPNPERGFYVWSADNFLNVAAEDLAGAAADGRRLLYAPVRLDAYRNAALPQSVLEALDRAFGYARSNGVKLIMRFTYNYPESETEYRNAKDASLSRVRGHLQQLQPVLADNADVIAYFQAGFIGAWGEWHTSSNNLTTAENKRAVRDALLAALPQSTFVQMRYPYDMVDWFGAPPDESLAFTNVAAARIGMHNDCFLASQTDVGTYRTTATSDPGRAYARGVSKVAPFGGETCNPADEEGARARMECADILREGAEYHLTYLNAEYYAPFFDRWRSQGCYDEVARRMGYRLQLKRLTHPASLTAGATLRLQLELENVGWSRLFNPRQLRITLRNRSSGQRFEHVLSDIDPRRWQAGATQTVVSAIPLARAMPAGDYDVLIGLPDAAASVGRDARYAVRFANADDASRRQRWDAQSGEFLAGTTLSVK